MSENTNETNVEETGAVENTATEDSIQNNGVETISISKEDYDKAVQSAEDKVRSKLHKQIKDLETKLATLETPKKSDSDKELEARVAEIEAREKIIALKEGLHDKNLDRGFADYLKDGVDVDALAALIDKVTAERVKAQGYVPSGHSNNTGITLEDWKKLSYTEREKLYQTNPELALEYAKK